MTSPYPGPADPATDHPSARPRRSGRAAHRRSWIRRHQYLTVSIAVVALLAGLGIGIHVAAFYATSNAGGHALIKRFHHQAARAAKQPAVSCQALSDSVSGPQALVVAHQIGLTAPVEGGDDDAVLNVAVGHVPGSAWPNQPGTTLLAAHDVSYFADIDQLSVGQTVDFITPCDTYVYRITQHQVVAAGSPIYTSPANRLLILETCYPLNALFITSQRYLVTASLDKVEIRQSTVPTVVPAPAAPSVPAPPALVAQGLSLDDNEVLLGVLTLTGSPSSAWRQGPAPMADEAAALADYFAGLRTAEQNQAGWWSALAPNVSFDQAKPMQGARVRYSSSLMPTLETQGSNFVGATIAVNVSIDGGSEPGNYAVTVQETVSGDQLEITQWTLQPS